MKQLNLNLKSDFQFKLLAVREASEEKANDPESVYELMKEEAKADRECFWVLHLNARLKIIEKELVSMGVLNASLAHPREVFKKAIINGASVIITVHNHPSGSLQPSEDDIENWARLTKAGKLLGIPVKDHLIISTKGFYSHSSATKKHGQGGLDFNFVKESLVSYRTKTFQVVCHGKVISKHIDFYHAQDYIPILFKEGRIDNSYTIEPICKHKATKGEVKQMEKNAISRELAQEEIEEARKTGYCPFCKDECKGFWCSVSAIQEFYLDDEGKIQWGTLEGLDNVGNVECKNCDEAIPSEICEAWFGRKQV